MGSSTVGTVTRGGKAHTCTATGTHLRWHTSRVARSATPRTFLTTLSPSLAPSVDRNTASVTPRTKRRGMWTPKSLTSVTSVGSVRPAGPASRDSSNSRCGESAGHCHHHIVRQGSSCPFPAWLTSQNFTLKFNLLNNYSWFQQLIILSFVM